MAIKQAKFSLFGARELIYFQIVYSFFIKWIIGAFELPSAFSYVTDGVTIILLIYVIIFNITKKKLPVRINYKIITIFFAYTVFNFIAHDYSFIYFLWGLRNTFRFYVFFIACTVFLDRDDIYKLIKIVLVVFALNMIMCLVQFLFMGYRQDYIAGFFAFGPVAGGNGPLIILMTIAVVVVLVRYMEREAGLVNTALVFLLSMTVAVIGELKGLIVILIAVAAMTSVFTRFSVKKIVLICAFAACVPIAINAIYRMYPNFAGFFTIENIMGYAASDRGYTGSGDINRFTAIGYCFEHFLHTPLERIFGLGLGAADGSTNFEIVTSPFFEKYSNATHYTWFTVPMILIENGVFGLVLYLSFFIMVLRDTVRMRKVFLTDKTLIIIIEILSLMGIFYAFYNQALRTESIGYTFYFFMSVPYILMNTKTKSLYGKW